MMKSRAPQLLAFLGCALLLFSGNACSVRSAGIHIGSPGPVVKGGPPPHAPAHGYRAKHMYHYYPDSYVYFDVSRNVYFFLEGSRWTMSASLPYSLQVELAQHIEIEMDTDRPYTHFDSHKQKYPAGHMKKSKTWAKKKKW